MSNTELIDQLNQCTLKTPKFDIKDETHVAKVLSCYDGDTFTCALKYNSKCQLFKVRLLGYNSPEIRQSRSLSDEVRAANKAKAQAAKAKLQELTLNKIVRLECSGFDNFGRILADVYVDGLDKKVNDVMIDEGYGVVFEG